MRTVVCAAVLMALVAVAPAKKYTLCDEAVTSGNMAFNYEPRAPWTGAEPRSLKLGLDDTDVSILFPSAMTINSGGELLLPDNVDIKLPQDGFEIRFSESMPSAGDDIVYSFDPSNVDISCQDTLCEDNGDGTAGARSPDPLCDGDVLVLYKTRSYFVSLTESNPNFRFTTFSNLRYHGQDYDDCETLVNLSPREFHLNCDSSKFFLDNLATCEANHWTTEDDKCFCHTSCPSATQALQQQEDFRNADKRQAEAQKELSDQNATTTFVFKVDLSDIVGDSADAIKAYFQPPDDNKEPLERALRERLQEFWNSDDVTVDVQLEEDGGLVLTIKGEVTASAGELFGTDIPSQEELDHMKQAGLLVDSTQFSDTDSSVIIDELLSVAGTKIEDKLREFAQKDLQDLTDACTSCPDTLSDIALDLGNVVKDPTSLDTTALVACANDANPLQCVTDLIKAVADPDATDEEITAVAKTLADLLDGVKDDPTALDEIKKFLDDSSTVTKDLNENKEAAKNAVPSPRTLSMTVDYFYAGGDTYLIVSNPLNLEEFRETAVQALAVPLTLTSNDPDNLNTFTVKLVEPSQRREPTTSLSPHLESTIQYTKQCYQTETDEQCQYATDSDEYKQVQQILETIARLIDLKGPQCYDVASGWDQACLQAIADEAFKTVKDKGGSDEDATKAAKKAVLAVRACNPLKGVNPDGTCVEDDPTAVNAATQIASAAQSKHGTQASTGGSKASIVPIAGAAAAVVIVAIICFVVYKMRSQPARKNNVDRNVVAFENPMYDEVKTVPNPVYDPADEDGAGLYDELGFTGSEGLYDEPDSFGFNEEDFEDDDGYLDTHPNGGEDDTGYLDTQPNPEGEEDTGYLDTAPEPQAEYMYQEDIRGFDDDEEDGGGYLDVHQDE